MPAPDDPVPVGPAPQKGGTCTPLGTQAHVPLAEEYASDLENGARIEEVDSGVLERAVGGSVGGRKSGVHIGV